MDTTEMREQETRDRLAQKNAEIAKLRGIINDLALPLAELITAYQDADSPGIQDTLNRGRNALAKSMA